MRKFSLVLVAAMLLSVGSVFANDSEKEGVPTNNLSSQIVKLLNHNDFSDAYIGSTAQVLFMLNSDKEIVVLSVDTDHEGLEGFIKGRLNYQEVNFDKYEAGKKYTVSVRIEI